MKLFHYYDQDGALRLGLKTEKGHLDLPAMARREGVHIPQTLDEMLRMDGQWQIQALAQLDPIYLDEEQLCFAPAIASPEKMLCVGLNYAAHAQETGSVLPAHPTIFCKLPNALNRHGGAIVLPASASHYDYEAELVIVIGKRAKTVTPEQAPDYIFGYTCGNDFTARDIQKRTSQWVLGKSLDGSAPVGPYVVSQDSIDVKNLTIKSYVNGQARQHSNTGDLIFSCSYLVSDLSQYLTLQPGDLIFTGTPSGVIFGYPPEKQQWLKAGDVVEVEIEGIGRLKNVLKAVN